MTNAILRGKPDAGNPHVRFDEGEVASAKPRRGSLLYNAKHLEAALSLRAGIDSDQLAKEMGDQVVEAAQKDMDMPLRSVLAECMRLEGIEPPRSFDNAAIKAAFSTVSVPGILSNVANKKLMQAYNAQPIIATKLCTT